MKSKEELNVLKEEVEALNKKLSGLTEEELAQVSGGGDDTFFPLEYDNKLPTRDEIDFRKGKYSHEWAPRFIKIRHLKSSHRHGISRTGTMR